MLGGADPLPGVQDFRLIEVAGLGLEHGRARGQDGHGLFPLAGAHHRHTRDVVGVLLEEAHLVPARRQFGAMHGGEVGENADGLVLALGEQVSDLRLEAFNVFGGHFAGDLEADDAA